MTMIALLSRFVRGTVFKYETIALVFALLFLYGFVFHREHILRTVFRRTLTHSDAGPGPPVFMRIPGVKKGPYSSVGRNGHVKFREPWIAQARWNITGNCARIMLLCIQSKAEDRAWRIGLIMPPEKRMESQKNFVGFTMDMVERYILTILNKTLICRIGSATTHPARGLETGHPRSLNRGRVVSDSDRK